MAKNNIDDKRVKVSGIGEMLHHFNRNINSGWNNLLNPYISMAYYISVPELFIAKLFPHIIVGSVTVGAVTYVIMLILSYRSGRRYNKMEEKYQEKVAARKKLKAKMSK